MDNGDNPLVPIGMDAMVGTSAVIVFGGLRLYHDKINHCGRSQSPGVAPIEKIASPIVGVTQVLVSGVKLFRWGVVSDGRDAAPYREAF